MVSMVWSIRSLQRRLGASAAAGLALLLAAGATVATATAAGPHGGAGQSPTVIGYAKKYANLAYATKSKAEKLDLYLPKAKGKTMPLVIKIHGGAFQAGDKSQETAGVNQLLAAGFAVAPVNYRLSGEARFPAGAQDIKAAIRYLRANAKRYNLNPGKFALWGESAGGGLAALVGASSNRTTVLDGGGLGNESVSSAVQAVVDWYGPTDLLTMDAEAKSPGGCPIMPETHNPASSPESLWIGAALQSAKGKAKQASAVNYVKAGKTPPFYIAHGNADCLVPYGQSLELAKKLKSAGVTYVLKILSDYSHADPRFDQTQTAPSIAFLKKVLAT